MTATPWGLPLEDLTRSVDQSSADLLAWRGARILITGGTGFLGSWLVATMLHANRALRLDLKIDLVARSGAAIPLNVRGAVRVIECDVRSVSEEEGEYALIVHGAASSGASYGTGDGEPRTVARTIVDGTNSVLQVAARSRAQVVFLSSGAVYGQQTTSEVAEDDRHGPDPLDPRMAYGEAKRLAETLCAAATAAGDAKVTVARLFAFVGPRIPLDGHFAVGNFLADVRARRPIRVLGDGSTVRAYLYAGDLPEWCWAIATRGEPGRAYNVGSSRPVTIAQLAELVRQLGPEPVAIQIEGKPSSGPVNRYVPNTERARSELGLSVRTDLPTALRKSYRWIASAR